MDIVNHRYPESTTLLRALDGTHQTDSSESGDIHPHSQERLPEYGHADSVETPTLLSLIEAINEVTDDDQEIIATVAHLLSSGRVRLRGHFQDESVPVTVSRH
jgi:hypothetical protein